MRLLEGQTGAPTEGPAAAGGSSKGPEEGKSADSEGTPESTDAVTTQLPPTTTAFSPLAFDQSYTWMMQLVVLVAAMTLFFPFLRNLFGVKSKKRQVANYTTYDSDEDCDGSYEEDAEECCEEE